jgi:murein DD-endopeptidase MepM/ murein hydrolase activator NlpD
VHTPDYLVYEENLINYYILKLEGTPEAKKIQREVITKRKEAKGTINSSLYDAFVENGMSIALAMEMSEIFAWTVDFYKVQKGDAFKVIYFEKYVEENPVGIAGIEAAYFNHYGKAYYAFRFEQEGRQHYFDENGQSVRKIFLKSPLKFSRISSRYNLKRFHPVLKRVKAHLGTDYAAPSGTPIMTVGDGTVIEAGYTAGNGNYVKIKHNSVYTTQYLHMSKFSKGMKRGKRVSQGEVIGYVGSTGLATGPHLCFRFWKNGKQVDPHREKPMQTTPVNKDLSGAFKAVVAQLKPELDNI